MKPLTPPNGQTETAQPHAAARPQPQLELPLAGPFACQSPAARRRRLTRANWWFQRMRQVVDLACDWQPAPQPRPEQTWFPNTHRKPSVLADLNPSLTPICE